MKEISKKIEKEVNEYKETMVKQGAEHCYSNSYEISMMEELNYFFTDYVESFSEFDDYETGILKQYDSLINIDNVCKKIIEFYYGMKHSEYYDFHNIMSLIDIIDLFIETNNNDKGNK